MNCDICQSRLCEQLDLVPSGPSANEVEEHLMVCPACRRLQQTLFALEEPLTRNTSQVALPADFAAKVLARLPLAKPRLSRAEIAERKARYEREYQAAMATIGWRQPFLTAAAWLRLASFTGMCAGVGWLLADTLGHLPMHDEWIQVQSFTLSTAQMLAYGIGLAAVAFGVLVARHPRTLRMLQ